MSSTFEFFRDDEDEAPQLYIWGYFQDTLPPLAKLFSGHEELRPLERNNDGTRYEVVLFHHESEDCETRQPRSYGPSRHRTEANISLRLDRHATPDQWDPFEKIVHYEVEHDYWVPVKLFLWNRLRSTRFGSEVQPLPTSRLLQSVSLYFQGEHGNLGFKSRFSPSLPVSDFTDTWTSAPVRGRKKSAKRHSTAAKGCTASVTRMLPDRLTQGLHHGTTASPRGRLKRRLRRNQEYRRIFGESLIRTQTTVSDISTQEARGSDRGPHQRNRSLIADLETRELPKEVFKDARIVVAQSESVLSIYSRNVTRTLEYHPGDGIVAIPIKNRTGSSIVGWLFTSKAALSHDAWRVAPPPPWNTAMVNGVAVDITKLETSEDSALPGTLKTKKYWKKFPLRACHLYESELRHIEHNATSHMAFAIQWSYQCPALISPDESEGVFASEDEYCRHTFLVSPKWFKRHGIDGVETYETISWLKDASEMWQAQRREWKDVNILGITDEQAHVVRLPNPPRFKRRQRPHHRSMNRTDYYFTRAIGLLEFEKANGRDKSDAKVPFQKLMESLSRTSSRSPSPERSMSALDVEQSSQEAQEQRPDIDSFGTATSPHHSAAPSPEGADREESGWEYETSDDLREDDEEDSYSIDEVEKNLEQNFTYRTKVHYYRDIFYGARYFGLVPWWTQKSHLKNLLTTLKNLEHHEDLRSHAMLQYSLCLFHGFGIGRDIEQGLRWFWLAARAGNRKARAVVQRLFRSYGETVPDGSFRHRWLIREAKSGSQLALDELRFTNPSDYEAGLVDRAFQSLGGSSTENLEEFEAMFRRAEHHINDLLAQPHEKQNELPNESPVLQFMDLGGIEWAACYADPVVVQMLQRLEVKFGYSSQYKGLNSKSMFLVAALSAGRAEVAQAFLDNMLANNEVTDWEDGVRPLFVLHHIPDVQVGSIVTKLIQLGEDVNCQVHVPRSSNHFLQGSFRGPGRHWELRPGGLSITPLRWAVENHKPAVVKALLDHGAEFPLVPDLHTYVAMHPECYAPEHTTIAVLDSPCYDVEILNMFFQRHGNQDKRTVFAETPLGLIATEPDGPQRRLRIGHLGLRENLFSVLDLIRTYQTESDSELFRAAITNGHLDIVQYLLLRGVSIETRCCGLTPLHTAVLHGEKAVFDHLLDLGADPFATTTRKGISAAHLVFWKPKPAEVEAYMLCQLRRHGVDVLARDTTFGANVSPLHLAVMGARLEGVDRLLRFGADKSMPLGEEIMPALTGARLTKWGIDRSERVEPANVARNNCDITPVTVKGLTPLGILLQRWDMYTPEDHLRLVKMLCTRSNNLQDFYTRPDLKQTGLHLASCHPVLVHAGVLEYILEQGRDAELDINIPDINGDTPLHYASLLGGGRQRLVALGADPRALNSYGMTPVDIRFQGHMYKIGADPKLLPRMRLGFGGISSRNAEGPEDELAEGNAPEHGSPCARLWARLGEGAVFREVWDVEERTWHSLDDDVVVRLRIAHDERTYPPWL